MGVLTGVVLLFLLPALTRTVPLFQDDCTTETIPRAIGIARCVQNGEIPLWDSHTLAGSKPFTVNDGGALFYPVMFPFRLMANLNDVDQATFMLLILPYCLHVLWGAIGGYVFGRWGLRLHWSGAFVLGLLHGLSAEMAVGLIVIDICFIVSYLPWIMLGVARFTATGRVRWWATAVAFLVLASTVGYAGHLVRLYVVVAAAIGLVWLFSAKRNALRWRRLVAGMGILAVSGGISGFVLAGILEGALWARGAIPMTYETASSLQPQSSTHPLYLLSLFIPDFFGELDGYHGWGITVQHWIHGVNVMGGGLFVMVAVLGCLLFWLRRRPSPDESGELRAWTLASTISLLLFLFTVMGRFTPVFKVLCAALPWFFRFPHAVYYRFGVSWSLAVLAAIGVSSFFSVPAFRERLARWRVPVICVGIAVAGIVIALLYPVDLDGQQVPGFRTLGVYGEWKWLLLGPLLYFCVASFILLERFARSAPSMIAWVMLLGVVVETVAIAGILAYVHVHAFQRRKPPDYVSTHGTKRYASMKDDPMFSIVSEFSPQWRSENVRYTFTSSSQGDNMAWATNAWAFLGDPTKSVEPRFREVIASFTVGMPYPLRMKTIPLALLHNMNTGYFVARKDLQFADPAGKILRIGATDQYIVYKLPDPLPYVHVQDCLHLAPEREQYEHLLHENLSNHTALHPDEAARVPAVQQAAAGSLLAHTDESFNALQARNRIVQVDRSAANRTTIEIDVTSPALLVIAECWHPGWTASVDGRPQPVLRVNYLEQAVWLEPGRHTVKLKFFPPCLRYGLMVSGVSGLIFAAVVLAGAVRRRVPGTGPMNTHESPGGDRTSPAVQMP